MIRILMLGGTGAIGESILSVIGNDVVYDITEYDNIVDWYIEYHDLVRWEDGLNA